jgi:hypothetical protein
MSLHNKLKELDDIIVNTVAANSKEWLGKEFNVAVLKEALYKPMVRPGKEQYPSTIKLKILTKPDGSFVPEAYSMQKQPVSLDTIEKGHDPPPTNSPRAVCQASLVRLPGCRPPRGRCRRRRGRGR